MPEEERGVDAVEVREKVLSIIRERLGILKEISISDDAEFIQHLHADSLDAAEIIMELENAFDSDIPDEDASRIRTVGLAIQYCVYLQKGANDSNPLDKVAADLDNGPLGAQPLSERLQSGNP